MGELGSSILTSGVSALLSFPFEGEDWKNMGEDDGAAAPSRRRLDARGVVCSLPDLGVGLLVDGCWRDRVERAGEAAAESLV